MKARVKATGDTVDATYWNTSANGIKYYDINNSGYTMTEDELDFDFSYTPDYWERLKHQAAIAAMQGIMTNPIGFENIRARVLNKSLSAEVAFLANEFATALVEKLKSEEKK